MHKSLIIKALILFVFVACTVEIVSAQRSSRRSSRTRVVQEDPYQGNRLGISLGTLGFFNGWSISAKGSFGYQLNRTFMAGLNSKFFFDSRNVPGPNITLFSYGAAAFVRLHLTDEIYAQGEYGRISLEQFFTNGTKQRNDFTYPSVGGGYQRGFGDWTYGFHILVPLDIDVADSINVEYWIDFNYKF